MPKVFKVTVLLEATFASPNVPVPDNVSVSVPTKLLSVRLELLALFVPSYTREPDEPNTRFVIFSATEFKI